MTQACRAELGATNRMKIKTPRGTMSAGRGSAKDLLLIRLPGGRLPIPRWYCCANL